MQIAISNRRNIARSLKFFIAFGTNIEICYEFRFISIAPRNDLFLTFVTTDNIFPSPFDVILTKLISQWDPSRSQVVVSRKEFNFFGAGDHHFDKCINLIRFLGLLSNLCHNQVIGNFGLIFDIFVWRAFVSNQTYLTRMQEVETLWNVDLIILCLNPRELIHNFISPLVETFVADVHLRI